RSTPAVVNPRSASAKREQKVSVVSAFCSGWPLAATTTVLVTVRLLCLPSQRPYGNAKEHSKSGDERETHSIVDSLRIRERELSHAGDGTDLQRPRAQGACPEEPRPDSHGEVVARL